MVESADEGSVLRNPCSLRELEALNLFDVIIDMNQLFKVIKT